MPTQKLRKLLLPLIILFVVVILHFFGYLEIFLSGVFVIIYSFWTFFSLLFLISFIKARRMGVYINPDLSNFENYPLISVLIPLYREKKKSIERTVNSILEQDYPKDKIEIIFILEPDDLETNEIIDEIILALKEKKVLVKKVLSDGKLKIKARALNIGLSKVKGEIVGVFDADDKFPPDYFKKVVKIFEKHCDYGALGTRVYRYGNSLLGKLLLIDTYLWSNVYVPAITGSSNMLLLSGEGFFVKRNVIDKVGGFSEVLLEDAQTSIKIRERGYKVGLVDSVVIEEAPKNLKAFAKQRLRWYKGYMDCLNDLRKSQLPQKTKTMLILAMNAPAAMSLGFLPIILFISYLLIQIFFEGVHIKIIEILLSNSILFYWELIISIFTIAFYIVLFFKFFFNRELRSLSKLVLLFPLYWLLLLSIALIAPFTSSKKWYKTER